MTTLYNLLADIISTIKTFPDDAEPNYLDETYEQELVDCVRGILRPWHKELDRAAIKGLPDNVYTDILSKAKTLNNYYIYRILLCELDGNSQLGWEEIKNKTDLSGFEALNTNVNETGILILPKVSGPQTTYKRYNINDADVKEELLPRKTADEWVDNLNECFGNFYYIKKKDLNGYTLRNYMCNLTYSDTGKSEMKIGLAPLWNLPFKKMLAYDDTIKGKDEAGNRCLYLGKIEVKEKDEVFTRFCKSFKTACKNDVDIFMGPEMLGTHHLYDLDQHGFNKAIKTLTKEEKKGKVPQLILAPTLWENNSNKTNVYLQTGRKLCSQYKQHRYRFKGKKGNCREDLRGAPKEICVIHVPQWGRITIPICIDFLFQDYREIMVKAIKADILLCPSYSPGVHNFLKALDAFSEFGVYVIWLDTCSALEMTKTGAPEMVGAVCTPSVSSKPRIERLIPKCNGECKGCLFVVTIPLNCMGEDPHEDIGAKVDHVDQ